MHGSRLMLRSGLPLLDLNAQRMHRRTEGYRPILRYAGSTVDSRRSANSTGSLG